MSQQDVLTTSKLKSFKISYLGCRVNQYEAQVYRDQLEALGLIEKKEEQDPADLCIINTCAVTLSAESSSRNQIRKILRENPTARVVITGCSANAAQDLFQDFRERCLFFSNREKEDLINKIFPYEKIFPEFRIKNFSNRSRAFIKVQDGCNSFCTYCIIPYLRGKSRSRTISSILTEVRELTKKGFKEVVVTGINVGDFNSQGQNLNHLIQELDSVEGLERIRISSIDPDDITADLFNTLVSAKKTCASLHLVLQSGSNSILKRMNRKYNRSVFLKCIEKFRDYKINFSISTDVIVGFPGEQDQDFEDTVNVIEQVKFSKVHIFPYSPRLRTKAETYIDRVPVSVINQRKRRLLQVANDVAFSWREQFIGNIEIILVEQVSQGFAFGHSDAFISVKIPDKSFLPGALVSVKILSNSSECLIGKAI